MARRIVSVPGLLFLRRAVSDSTLGLRSDELDALRAISLRAGSIYGDRFRELRMFWGGTRLQYLALFVRDGWPFTARQKRSLLRRFNGRTSPDRLTKAYADSAFHYTMFHMLSMHRGEWLLPFLPDLRSHFGARKGRILDYGCGVSDMGLLLGKEGHEITLVDLANRKLEFAQWRYRARGLECKALSVADTERLPALPPNTYDVVIATEILEHVRDPLAALRTLRQSLKANGLFFCSMGLGFDRDVEGDHLAESVRIGNGPEYRRYFSENFRLIADHEGHPWLFQVTS